MKRIFVIAMLASFSSLCFAQLTVSEHTLSNGMKVWLNEDHSSAKVFGAVAVNAGAIDCPKTGIAHYFEHIAFKGTDKIGTVDFEKEKIYLDSIEALYNELLNVTDVEARRAIQKRINELSIESAKYVIPNEFDHIIAKFGGTDLNAYTSNDRTVYHNSFSAQYINQWCEINSERLMNPVFRLFQSELETIYEEKNMYDDYLGSIAMEKLTEQYYAPNPNAYPVIGTTENLKNPSMKDMRAYYNRFYVAGNMALVLSGDFESATILPLLEKTFGRIKKGEPNPRIYEPARIFKGREEIEIKLNIPIIAARALAWRGLSATNEDCVAMDLASAILSNSNGTGYLDKLEADGKLMGAGCLNENSSDNGMLAIMMVPNIFGLSINKTEELIWQQVNRLKSGDIDSALLESVKKSITRQHLAQLETIDSRSNVMIDLLVCGKSWQSYFDKIARIKSLTAADISAVANKYFTSNYGCATKKMGDYPKDKLEQPGFAPIKAHNVEAKSAYAAMLDTLPVLDRAPKFVDFSLLADSVGLAPLAVLYRTANEINELFSVNFIFNKGYRDNKQLAALDSYLDYVGSDSLSKSEFAAALQNLGADISFKANGYSFNINVTGFDYNFESTMRVVTNFLNNVAADDTKSKKVAQDYTVSDKSFDRSPSEIASVAYQVVAMGAENAITFVNISPSEARKMKGADYVALWKELQKSQCEVLYCGTITADKVASTLQSLYNFEQCKVPHSGTHYITPKTYDSPTIFFVNQPASRQTIIYGITPTDKIEQPIDVLTAEMMDSYIGGGMSSLLFQEIREFRSMAYGAYSFISIPTPAAMGERGYITSSLSTQTDKANQALPVLDSILKNIKFSDQRLAVTRNEHINEIYNDFPSVRNIASTIVLDKKLGHAQDPNIFTIQNIDKVDAAAVQQFYNDKVKTDQTVYVVVGNSKKMDIKALAKYGKVVVLKPSQLKP